VTRGRKDSKLEKAGQIELWLSDGVKKRKTSLAKIGKPPTKAQEKIVQAGTVIRQESPSPEDYTFLARELVQCGLPHRDPGTQTPMWVRRNGDLTLTMVRTDPDVGYPWGSHPRLFLFWINTEVLRTENRRLELGRYFSTFVRELGLHPSHGGRWSDYRRLQNQMERTLAASISFKRTVEVDGMTGTARLNMPVASQSILWWDYKRPEQGTIMPSWMLLSEEFFRWLLNSPVPMDLRAIRALKQSPLALDLYAWAAYKAYYAATQNRDQFATWRQLMEQCGTSYEDVKDFRRYATAQLRNILCVFPSLKLCEDDGRLVVKKESRPPIAPQPARRNLVEKHVK